MFWTRRSDGCLCRRALRMNCRLLLKAVAQHLGCLLASAPMGLGVPWTESEKKGRNLQQKARLPPPVQEPPLSSNRASHPDSFSRAARPRAPIEHSQCSAFHFPGQQSRELEKSMVPVAIGIHHVDHVLQVGLLHLRCLVCDVEGSSSAPQAFIVMNASHKRLVHVEARCQER